MSQHFDSGVSVERRGLLIVGMAAPFFMSAARAETAGADELSYDSFLETAQGELRPLLPAATAARQDEYVYRAASLLRRLKDLPPQQWAETRKLDIHSVGPPKVFAVTALRAKPGAILPPHNHPNYSVATMGLAGEVRVRNFEPAGVLPPYSSKDPFQLQQTSDRWLKAHDIITLTAERDNFHTFEAGPNGASWVDISTPHANSDGSDFSYLRLSPRPDGRVGDIYEALWGLKA